MGHILWRESIDARAQQPTHLKVATVGARNELDRVSAHWLRF